MLLFVLALIGSVVICGAIYTSQDLIVLAIPIVAVISFICMLLWGLILRRLFKEKKQKYIYYFIVLAPALLFSVYYVWNYSIWRIPYTIFKTKLCNPIPKSVQNIKGRSGGLKGYFEKLYFEIDENDFTKIFNQKYVKINGQDDNYLNIINTMNDNFYSEEYPSLKNIKDIEVFSYGIDTDDFTFPTYYLITNKHKTKVYFYYCETYD